MIRGHDYKGLFEQAATLQFVEEDTKLLVNVRKTVVIRIPSQSDQGPRQPPLVEVIPLPKNGPVVVDGRVIGHEPMRSRWGQQVGIMSVQKIQEGKERTAGFSSLGEPREKRAVDRRGIFALIDHKPAIDEVP